MRARGVVRYRVGPRGRGGVGLRDARPGVAGSWAALAAFDAWVTTSRIDNGKSA